MPIHRVRIEKENAELVKCLGEGQDNQAPFQTYADVLVFAAALGSKWQQRLPIITVAKEPSPISLEVFVSRGYDWLFKLLAIAATQNPQILSLHEAEAESQRVLIFEEYANAGLMKLQEDLRGAVSYAERIALILNQERYHEQKPTPGEFDLSRFF